MKSHFLLYLPLLFLAPVVSFLTPVGREGKLLSPGKPKGERLLSIHVALGSREFSSDGSQQIPTWPSIEKLPNHVYAPWWAAFLLQVGKRLAFSITFFYILLPVHSIPGTIESNNTISSDCCSLKSNIKVLGFLLYTRSQRKTVKSESLDRQV